MSALDLRPPMSVNFVLFGAAGSVTPKGGSLITTTVIPTPPGDGVNVGSVTAHGRDQVPDLRQHFSVRKAEVPSLPVGSVIVAPACAGGPVITWTVTRVDDLDPEVFDVVVEAA